MVWSPFMGFLTWEFLSSVVGRIDWTAIAQASWGEFVSRPISTLLLFFLYFLATVVPMEGARKTFHEIGNLEVVYIYLIFSLGFALPKYF